MVVTILCLYLVGDAEKLLASCSLPATFLSRGRWPSSWPTAPVLGPGSIGRCRWSSAWPSAARRPPVWPRPPPSSPRTSGSKPAAGLARRRLCPSSPWTSGWESRRSGTLSRLLERLMSAGSRTGAFKLESYDDARKMALVVIFHLNDPNFFSFTFCFSVFLFLSLPLFFSLSLSLSYLWCICKSNQDAEH